MRHRRPPHAEAGRLENELRSAGYVMAETGYEPPRHTVLRVALPDDAAAISAARSRLASLTAGNLELRPQGTEWVDVPPR